MTLIYKDQVNNLSEMDEQELWEKYYVTKDINIRNKLIERYSNLVKMIALKLRGVYQQYGDVDDVVNEGIIALMDVIERFDKTKNTKFETYAAIRIKGAIIDYVRKQDWIPRKIKNEYKTVKNAEEVLSNKLGRAPNDSEIADYLKINIKDYNNIINNAHGTSMLSFEELLLEASITELNIVDGYDLPEQEIETKELYSKLSEGIKKLNENEQLVISLYYKEELKLKEIAEVLNLSNSRVSQIHSTALVKLEKHIKEYINDKKGRC